MPHSHIRFRPGTADDGAAMLDIHRNAVLNVAIKDYGPEIAASWAHGLTVEGYGKGMKDGAIFEVAMVNGHIVAFCSTRENEVTGLFVDPDHMGKGIGAALLLQAVARFERAGATEAVLIASITGVALYERLGFRQVRSYEKSTRGGLNMAVVDMVRKFNPMVKT